MPKAFPVSDMHYTFMQHCVANRKYRLAKEKEASVKNNSLSSKKSESAKQTHSYGGVKYELPEDISKLDIEMHPAIKSLRSERYHPFEEKDEIDLTEEPGSESVQDLLSRHFSNLLGKKAAENFHDITALSPEKLNKILTAYPDIPEKPYYAASPKYLASVVTDYLQDDMPNHELDVLPKYHREENLVGKMQAGIHHLLDNYEKYHNEYKNQNRSLHKYMLENDLNPKSMEDRTHAFSRRHAANLRDRDIHLENELIDQEPKSFIDYLYNPTAERPKNLPSEANLILHNYLHDYITHAFRGQ